ncbi:MAG: SusD/RagB family nutrient-binding outer membrane lipoprotein [Chitinophagaceae bacterium]
MKNIISNIMVVLFILTAITSCKKDFGTLNNDPNTPAVPSTKFLFGSAVMGVRGMHSSTAAALYVQHMSEFYYTQESRYLIKIYQYDAAYASPLMDLQTIIRLNTDVATKNNKSVLENGTNENQLGHARILKAFMMLHVTDRWGAIPYTEALRGGTNNKPVFDTQKFVYNDILKELKEAALQVTKKQPNDPLFDGAFARWKTWANSLRAIVAMRMAATEDAAIAKAAFTEAVAAGIMTSNDDNVIYKYLSDANFQNPYYSNYLSRKDYGVSATIVNQMLPHNDPRLPVYASKSVNTGTYTGVPYGINDGYLTADYSLFGTAIYARNAPLQLTTYAQVCFTMAEAALRGWVTGGDAVVASWYQKGIEASMDQWATVGGISITATQKTTYRAQADIDIPAVNTLSFDQKLERVQTQKWLNFYMNNSYEAWAEWRRTGYPVLLPAPDAANADKQIPRRQCYSKTETDLNNEHYLAAVAAQGPDELSTRLWWDRR